MRRVIAPSPDSPSSQAVGVDFDETLMLVDRGWMDGQVYGEPIPGAIEALRLLAAHRAVFVYTARHRRFHEAVARWVTRHSGLATRVNDDPDRAYWTERGEILVTNLKLGAACYICDKAVHFDGDWTGTLPIVTRAIGLDRADGRVPA
ncbi:HAD family hydrolase [Kitasatospora azatica]|uniref:hypothetical protein n=1 Tax=Kitasatospora azatica TaxID=58347 RepID=UPI000561B23D|nr:hypothetical protein [Kitasatospora azatica]